MRTVTVFPTRATTALTCRTRIRRIRTATEWVMPVILARTIRIRAASARSRSSVVRTRPPRAAPEPSSAAAFRRQRVTRCVRTTVPAKEPRTAPRVQTAQRDSVHHQHLLWCSEVLRHQHLLRCGRCGQLLRRRSDPLRSVARRKRAEGEESFACILTIWRPGASAPGRFSCHAAWPRGLRQRNTPAG